MQFVRALSILGSLIALSIIMNLLLGGSMVWWIVGAWILSAPAILVDAWVRTKNNEAAEPHVNSGKSTGELKSVRPSQPEVQKLARRRTDE